MASELLISTRAGRRKLKQNLKEAALKGRRTIGDSAALWPKEYCGTDYETRCKFILECVWTFLEVEGRYEQIPDLLYIRWLIWHWCDTRSKGIPLVCWKPRRMCVSWLFRALELHDLGLFCGEHWLADEKLQKSEQQCWRYWCIFEGIRQRFKTWNLEPGKDFGSLDQKQLETYTLPNGSMFKRINSNPEALYGPGVRSLCLEEPHTYVALSDMISQALIIVQGSIGGNNGHVTLVGNSAPREGWIKLLKPCGETYRPQPGEFPAPPHSGVYLGNNGVRILDLNYRSDPSKDDAWVKKTKPGILNWDQEMEKSLDTQSGQPVFPTFDSTIHVPEIYLTASRKMNKHSTFILGIDTGINTMNHAAILLELTPGPPKTRRLIAVKEFCPEKAMMFQEFGRWCQNWIVQNVPQGYENDVIWVADRSITTREGLSHQNIKLFARDSLQENIIPISNAWEYRRAAVEWALSDHAVSETDDDEDVPRFALVKKDCPTLFRALLSGYCWREATNPTEGADMRRPEKNMFSHGADALQYSCIYAKDLLKKQEKEFSKLWKPSSPEEVFESYRSEANIAWGIGDKR